MEDCDTKMTHALIFKKVIHHMGSGMIALVVLNAAQCLAIIGLVDLSWPSEVEATAAQFGTLGHAEEVVTPSHHSSQPKSDIQLGSRMVP